MEICLLLVVVEEVERGKTDGSDIVMESHPESVTAMVHVMR